MNDALNNLPSLGQMFKLIIFLILAIIAISLVVALVKVLIPLLFVAAIIVGGLYLFKRLQEPSSAS